MTTPPTPPTEKPPPARRWRLVRRTAAYLGGVVFVAAAVADTAGYPTWVTPGQYLAAVLLAPPAVWWLVNQPGNTPPPQPARRPSPRPLASPAPPPARPPARPVAATPTAPAWALAGRRRLTGLDTPPRRPALPAGTTTRPPG